MGARADSPRVSGIVLPPIRGRRDVMRIEALLNPFPSPESGSAQDEDEKQVPLYTSRSFPADDDYAPSSRFRLRSMTDADWLASKRLPRPWNSPEMIKLPPRPFLQEKVVPKSSYYASFPNGSRSAYRCLAFGCNAFFSSLSELRKHDRQAHRLSLPPPLPHAHARVPSNNPPHHRRLLPALKFYGHRQREKPHFTFVPFGKEDYMRGREQSPEENRDEKRQTKRKGKEKEKEKPREKLDQERVQTPESPSPEPTPQDNEDIPPPSPSPSPSQEQPGTTRTNTRRKPKKWQWKPWVSPTEALAEQEENKWIACYPQSD